MIMKTKHRIMIAIGVTLLLLGVLVLQSRNSQVSVEKKNTTQHKNASAQLPRLLELGSTTCIPCKMMEKVLESLRRKYNAKLRVDFTDVTVSPEVGKKYKIKLIPTQIFFGADGREIYRHEGFFPEKDIVAKYEKLGYPLEIISDDADNNIVPENLEQTSLPEPEPGCG